MQVKNVDLTVSQLLNDLSEGLTWFKADDLGYGNIETKYGANTKQIEAIRKHPGLKDADTNITVFNIIDDTKEEVSQVVESAQPDVQIVSNITAPAKQTVVPSTPDPVFDDIFGAIGDATRPQEITTAEGADAFNNL